MTHEFDPKTNVCKRCGLTMELYFNVYDRSIVGTLPLSAYTPCRPLTWRQRMKRMLAKLWRDDQGAVISSELVLVLGIGTFGVIPGLVVLRDTVNKGLTSFAEPMKTVTDSAAKNASSISQTQANVNSTTAIANGNVVNVYNILPPSP